MYKDNANERNESLLSNSRVQLILYKDNANERNESLLSNSRVQLILYKDNANERNESLLSNSRVQLILYKDNHKMEYSKVITQFFSLFPVYLPELPLRHFNMVVQRRQQHG